MTYAYSLLRKMRARTMRLLKPRRRYFLFPAHRALLPISSKYGFDRGKPIDRYYIEKFLAEHKERITGACLEIHDDDYTVRFGEGRVEKSDVLDIDTSNARATLYGDLRALVNIPDAIYDCLIITQTIGMIDEYEAALSECSRILKPGGTLLLTASALAPMLDVERSYWRFSVASIRYLLDKCLPGGDMVVRSYGNVLAGQCYWVGLATDELTKEELEHEDPRFPIIIAARVVKPRKKI